MADKLKDMFFTPESVGAMAEVIRREHPSFDVEEFKRLVFEDEFESKELKQRMRRTTECLRKILPISFDEALAILVAAAPRVKGFEAMCLPDFVELYGLDHWDKSLAALAVFTRHSSSEFAIRPFIIKNPARAMAFMERLAEDEDPNVRRFASEGCRPRLPWAMALPEFKKNPGPVLPILEKLKDDESEFVRRSVSNNLNDISKDHPDIVLEICERWQGQSERTDWLIKRACRTMLKDGLERAMRLFGFGDPELIGIENLRFDKPRACIGDNVQLTFSLRVGAESDTLIRLEYAVDYVKSNGSLSRKVFQVSEKSWPPGSHRVSRKLSFADMSTRKHYPGGHRVTVIVNGIEKAHANLMLRE